MPKSERAKARKEAARHKVGLDLPPDLHETLRQIAGKEKVSISSLVAFLTQRGIEEYKAGKIDLFPSQTHLALRPFRVCADARPKSMNSSK